MLIFRWLQEWFVWLLAYQTFSSHLMMPPLGIVSCKYRLVLSTYCLWEVRDPFDTESRCMRSHWSNPSEAFSNGIGTCDVRISFLLVLWLVMFFENFHSFTHLEELIYTGEYFLFRPLFGTQWHCPNMYYEVFKVSFTSNAGCMVK